MSTMVKKKEKSWSVVWYDFSQSTTLHGVNKVGESKQHIIRRLIWVLIVLGGLTLFAYQLVNSVIHYRSWPVTVNVKINYNRTLQFPAITLCNQNDFRSSAIAEAGRYHLVRDFYSNLSTGGIDLEAAHAANISLAEIYSISSHRKEDMIVSCSWDESRCEIDDFDTTVTDYGYCYTFNSGRNGRPIRQVSNTGADRGLRLRLNIEQYEYMRGPNLGAGIKIMIHDADEIPLVRDLGQAIPPGSYAFVGIQIVQVNNLPPPHGQCDDSTQLQFFRQYSMSACLIDCKETVIAQECGCRDVYMPADENGYPPVCTLGQYQSCFYPAIAEFNKRQDPCNCTIPCRRTMFDPTISYAVTTNYETDSLLESKDVRQLHERYVHTRETVNRVEESIIAKDTAMVDNLNLTVSRVTQMLNRVSQVVQEMQAKLRNDLTELRRRTWFHWRWGLDKLDYVARHDFTRGWEVMSERTLGYVTAKYQEKTAYTKDAVRMLTEVNSTMTSGMREAMAINILGYFFQTRVVCERALSNVTQAYDAFLTAEPLLRFRASPQRRYDMSYISLGIVNDDLKELEKNYKNLVLRLTEYMAALNTMEEILREALENRTADMDALETALYDFEKAARSYNYYRFRFDERIAQRPVELTAALSANFVKLNDSLNEKQVEMEVFLSELILSLDDADSSWQHIMELNEQGITYLSATSITKTDLAKQFTSTTTEDAIVGIKSFLSIVKARARGLGNQLSRLERACVMIWQNMLSESALDQFYGNISQDITAFINGEEDRETLAEIFAYMLSTTTSTIYDNSTQLVELMNADFISTSIESKTQEIEAEFARLKQMNDIENVMKDEEDFFDAFEKLHLSLYTFLDNNRIDERFFGRNFMQVDVFMKELSYEQIDQQIAYDLTSLLSDIGGSIGLFIGASVITLFELLDVVILNSCRFYCHCFQTEKKRKLQKNGYAETPVML